MIAKRRRTASVNREGDAGFYFTRLPTEEMEDPHLLDGTGMATSKCTRHDSTAKLRDIPYTFSTA